MTNQDIDHTAKSYSGLMIALGIGYTLIALTTFFFPLEFLYLVNLPPTVFKLAEPIPLPGERLWLSLASVSLLMLAAMCLLSSRHPRSPSSRSLGWLHVFAKALAGSAMLYLFFRDRPYFAYLIAGGIDLPIAFFVSWKLLFLGKVPQ